MKEPFKVAILLAAYNGERWIHEQVNSIVNQKNVLVNIFVSIYISTDRTLNLLYDLQKTHPNLKILPYGQKFGSTAIFLPAN